MKGKQIEYDRQQLEYIKEWFKSEETAPFMAIIYEYFVSLIEWSEERLRLIEQVQELEKDVKEWKVVNESWEQINTQIVEQNKRYRERIEYMLGEAKDHKRKGLRIQHWALIKDLEEALEERE